MHDKMTRAGQRNGTKVPAYAQQTLPVLNTNLPALFTKREEWNQPSFSMSNDKTFGTYRSQVHYFSLNYELITRTNGSLKRSSKLLHYALNCCLLCT